MITIKTLTMRNFLSVGNVSQAVNFCSDPLTLVLGENLDLGGNDNRNGVGKSSIVNALSYALYGIALTSIKKDNLVNKTNGKNMLVTIEYEKDGTTYKIERGRRPSVFRYIVNNVVASEEESDEAQGDSRLTQEDIEREIGLSHNMFKNIVALNTFNTPFLSMKSNEQREIIEQLLGITKLSEKAEQLKTANRTTKDSLREEEYKIKGFLEANKQTQENAKKLKIKSMAWEKDHQHKISEKSKELEKLYHLDIDAELLNHEQLKTYNTLHTKKNAIEKDIKQHEKDFVRLNKELSDLQAQMASLDGNVCPTCLQGIASHTHDDLRSSLDMQIEDLNSKISDASNVISGLYADASSIVLFQKPIVSYENEKDAYNHKMLIEKLAHDLESEINSANPYIEQIDILETSIQEIDYTLINNLSELQNHQEFLLKLLTSKDSFIRKKIIDQNLSYLNKRLASYLEKVGLPHEVKFQSNLEVEITEHGRDLDFDNLSRGERTRLILSLSWAFRDVFESLNTKINLIFIDELIDNGLDTSGVESSLSVLKHMTRENNRNVLLISHRDELIGRVDNILRVVKEGGFTCIETAD